MTLKSSKTRTLKEKPVLPSSHRKLNSLPKMKPTLASEHPHYLVVDTTLPSHIFSNRSLFTTYVPSRKLHRTAFGTNIIIEGIGDVHVRVVVSGKSIVLRFRNSWYAPSSPHQFFSCSTAISLGNQVMIAGRSPRMIFPHKSRLLEPNSPKYMPFTRLDGFIVLRFDIPAQISLSPQPASTTVTTQSPIAPTCLSLQASTFHPFAGLSFHRNLLPTSQQVSGPCSFASEPMADAVTHTRADALDTGALTGVESHGGVYHDALVDMHLCFPLHDHALNTFKLGTRTSHEGTASAAGVVAIADSDGGAHDDVTADVVVKSDGVVVDVALHGDADALVDVDVCFVPNDDVNITSHGGADHVEIMMRVDAKEIVDGIINGDAEDHAANTVICEGDSMSGSAFSTHHYSPSFFFNFHSESESTYVSFSFS
jgi:hypothetical protein